MGEMKSGHSCTRCGRDFQEGEAAQPDLCARCAEELQGGVGPERDGRAGQLDTPAAGEVEQIWLEIMRLRAKIKGKRER